MMAWLRNLLATPGAFAVSWVGAIVDWRADQRMSAAGDLLSLMVLPLALLPGWWLPRKAGCRLRLPAAATMPSAASAVATPEREGAAPFGNQNGKLRGATVLTPVTNDVSIHRT